MASFPHIIVDNYCVAMVRQNISTACLCKKTSNIEHGWTPVKHVNVFHHNRTQKQLRHVFLNIVQIYYQLPIFGTLDMSGHFPQKR